MFAKSICFYTCHQIHCEVNCSRFEVKLSLLTECGTHYLQGQISGLKLLKITKALNGGFFWCDMTHLWVLFCVVFGSHAVFQFLNIRQVMAGIGSSTHPAPQPTRCPLWLLWFCLFTARLMGAGTRSSSYDHDWTFAVSHDHSNNLSTCAQINYAFRETSIWAVESLGCWNILFECVNAECKEMDV